jgi:hypothetical protein
LQIVITGKVKTLFAMRSLTARVSGLRLTLRLLLAKADPLTGSATERSAIKIAFTLPGIETYKAADSMQLGVTIKDDHE